MLCGNFKVPWTFLFGISYRFPFAVISLWPYQAMQCGNPLVDSEMMELCVWILHWVEESHATLDNDLQKIIVVSCTKMDPC